MEIKKIMQKIKDVLKEHQNPFNTDENLKYFINQLNNYLTKEGFSGEQIYHFLIGFSKLLWENNIKLEKTLISVLHEPSDNIFENNMILLIIDIHVSSNESNIYHVKIDKNTKEIIIIKNEKIMLTYNDIEKKLKEEQISNDEIKAHIFNLSKIMFKNLEELLYKIIIYIHERQDTTFVKQVELCFKRIFLENEIWQRVNLLLTGLDKNNDLKDLKENSIVSITYKNKVEKLFIEKTAIFNVLIIKKQKNYNFDVILDSDKIEIKSVNIYDNFLKVKEKFDFEEDKDLLGRHLYNILMNVSEDFPNILFDMMVESFKQTYKTSNLEMINLSKTHK